MKTSIPISVNGVIDPLLTASAGNVKDAWSNWMNSEKKPKGVIYLIGSLRDKNVPIVGEELRTTGYEVFDQWWTASEDADDWLRDYFKFRKLSYKDAIHSYAAKHIFDFDKYHLDRADVGVLVMPSGKSCHLELGYLAGQGKRTYVLFDKEPERVDIMYNFATDVFFDIKELMNALS